MKDIPYTNYLDNLESRDLISKKEKNAPRQRLAVVLGLKESREMSLSISLPLSPGKQSHNCWILQKPYGQIP
jgi:hypothetical protein